MKTINVVDKKFKLLMNAADIEAAVSAVAERINADYEGKTPLFVIVLNGAFMFASDLMKHVKLPCTMSCIKLSSYAGGTKTTGIVKKLIGLTLDLSGEDVIIVEDIVDTGTTMHELIPQLYDAGAASVEICTFLHKPESLMYAETRPKYIAKEIPSLFVVGYGLDYEEQGRNLPELYVLSEDND